MIAEVIRTDRGYALKISSENEAEGIAMDVFQKEFKRNYEQRNPVEKVADVIFASKAHRVDNGNPA